MVIIQGSIVVLSRNPVACNVHCFWTCISQNAARLYDLLPLIIDRSR